ncbi:MAG: VWA domain-containing protein [Myxococcota bacterium]|jgi:Ca-activated chloride channel homolog|nr:VWA domain-containing protein [Myxococcota bacterium]
MISGLEFRDPVFLVFLVLAPLVFALARRTNARVDFSSLALLAGSPGSWRTRLLVVPPLLLAAAAAALAIALAGPRQGEANTQVYREGIAIMLVVDRSGSMNARDFVQGDQSIDRLQVVQQVLGRFLGTEDGSLGRPDDLVGLVTFARYADSVAPLTLDHTNLTEILGDVAIVTDRDEDGTAVGEGLALAVERLRRHKAKSKVIILLTDGVSNIGDISPGQAADLAAANNIKVYAVGAGRTGYAPFPVEWRGKTVLRKAYVELDERTLEDIAQRTAGQYFHAENIDGLARVYEEIDELERSEIVEVRYMQYEEFFAYFAWAALALMILASLLGQSLLRRLP